MLPSCYNQTKAMPSTVDDCSEEELLACGIELARLFPNNSVTLPGQNKA